MSALVPPAGEYALRACACLAAAPPEHWMAARDLAVQANVPPAFLSKVLRRLVLGGVLQGQKGHHGGFRLARPAATIRIADILTAAEVELTPAHCAFGYAACDAHAPCPLHEVFTRLQGLCTMWARATTLADLDLSRIQTLLPGDLETWESNTAESPAPGGPPPGAGGGGGGGLGESENQNKKKYW